jgi:PII-like signaling protein
MKIHPRKQLTVICELPVASRITRLLDEVPVTGYTVIPAISGAGSEGAWTREGMIGDYGRMVVILSIMSVEQANEALERIVKALKPQMGIVTVSDVEVLRPELF